MKVAAIVMGPVKAYRLWRVMPFQPLDGPPTLRLCAAGTNGVPSQWPALAPVEAVCSAFDSDHAAPHPDHGCGVWALPTLEAVEKRVVGFTESNNFVGAYGVAVGEVALWGRVIEHTEGWRAQFAYPVSLTITSRREHTARAIGAEYGIPVDWRPQIRRRIRTQNHASLAEEFGAATKEFSKITSELDKIRREAAEINRQRRLPDEERWAEERRRGEQRSLRDLQAVTKQYGGLEPIRIDDVTVDEVLVAFAMSLAADGWQDKYGGPVDATLHLLRRRGYDGPLYERRSFAYIPASRMFSRPGFVAVQRKAIRALEQAAEAGLVEQGMCPLTWAPKQRRWFLTAAGIQHVRALLETLPLIVVDRRVWTQGGPSNRRIMSVDVLGHIADEKPRDPLAQPFTHEINMLREQWAKERMQAKRQGARSYRAWLATWRQKPLAGKLLRYTDAEIVTALRVAARKTGGAVPMKAMMERLAPGDIDATERGAVTYQLGRLREANVVQRSPGGLWAAA